MYKIIKQQKVSPSAYEIEIEVSKEAIEKNRTKALKHLGEHANLPGFRKGHIPEDILVKKIGEITIVEESLEETIKEIYPKIIEETKIFPIGYPKIAVTSIAIGSPAKVLITTDLVPEITLPDYKKIASKIMSKEDKIEVAEKEVSDVLEEVKKIHAQKEKKDSLIELTDEIVQGFGPFKTVAEFTEKLKANITEEKTYRAKEKKRIETLEEITKETKGEIPNVLIEEELNRMTNEFSHELSKIGSSFENYKKEVKKTDDEIRNEWKEKAEKRVKSELVLLEIAKEEKLKPSDEAISHEVKHIKEHYPDVEDARAKMFVEDTLKKEEVFKFFEGLK